jgi:hypothetical protein
MLHMNTPLSLNAQLFGLIRDMLYTDSAYWLGVKAGMALMLASQISTRMENPKIALDNASKLIHNIATQRRLVVDYEYKLTRG